MRERELLEHVYARSSGLAGPLVGGGELLAGPGDDCAVVRTPAGDVLVVTIDQLVEGRHYEPGTPTDLIARKAVARSVSDIAAMGGTPTWATATGALPAGYPHADELFDAMSRWARHWGCPLIGGDIASHAEPEHPLVLTVLIAGLVGAEREPLPRDGARAGDELWVSGAIGGSLASGRHLTFEPRVRLGRAAAATGAHAAIDLSDGLGRDADRLARASGVVVELDAGAVPLHPERAGDWRSACADGEDYELLIAIDPSNAQALQQAASVPLTRVGVCRAAEGGEPGAAVIDAGVRHPAGELGWDH